MTADDVRRAQRTATAFLCALCVSVVDAAVQEPAAVECDGTRLKSYSRWMLSATLSRMDTLGCMRPKSSKVKPVDAEPVTRLPSNVAFTCHVVGCVTPRTVRSPISWNACSPDVGSGVGRPRIAVGASCTVGNESVCRMRRRRSEEHTSELQSHVNLVCR